MKLKDLFLQYPEYWTLIIPPSGDEQQYLHLDIQDIVSDSRNVKSGDLYVAIKGLNVDGHNYIHEAIGRGALAICGSEYLEQLSVPYIRVENPRNTLAYLAAAIRGFPAKQLTVIGVTGTDGKTSTTTFIYHILRAAGFASAMISTVSACIGNEEIDTGFHVTTPEAYQIQALLKNMIQHSPNPITHVVLETTSHGLAQKRVAACFYDIAVYTNITHEHLDFHGTYADYLAAKASLIDELALTPQKRNGNYRIAILNKDDPSFHYLAHHVKKYPSLTALSYAITNDADIKAIDINEGAITPEFKIRGIHQTAKVSLSLMGNYHIYNSLAAWSATVEALGVNYEAAIEGLMGVKYIPGRMEPINMGQEFIALVDFAHTPNALLQALTNARRMTDKNVIVVFGSAGLRDKDKRWQMAEIAIRLANKSIFTAEDPRTEDIHQILREMKTGAEKAGGKENEDYFLIADRREAIRVAVSMATKGDLVILCGKGHEQSMCYGTIEYAWDDRVALRSAIAELLGIPGPEMPYLPD